MTITSNFITVHATDERLILYLKIDSRSLTLQAYSYTAPYVFFMGRELNRCIRAVDIRVFLDQAPLPDCLCSDQHAYDAACLQG